MSEKPLAGAGKPRMPWYPLFERDFTADTASWPPEAVGALIRLMNYQWHNGGIPYDQRHAARIAGFQNAEQWKDIWKTYLDDKFEQLNSHTLINRRLYREYVRIEKKGAQAKKAAEKRWKNQTLDADADADACASAMQTKNQEPRTKNKPTTSPTERVPHQAIVDLYHEHCPALPRVKVINNKRQAAMRARWKTFSVEVQGKERYFNDLETWERYFKFITNNCPFLLGQNDRSWVANFDFCIRETAMVGVFENKYVERK
jgi:uncharacterized protein YdaU (DUF1376 family)